MHPHAVQRISAHTPCVRMHAGMRTLRLALSVRAVDTLREYPDVRLRSNALVCAGGGRRVSGGEDYT